MATDWIYRVHIIVRAAILDVANEQAREIGIGGDDSEEVFDTVKLSALGQGEPTDYGCSTLMTASMFEVLKTASELPALASMRFYCVDAAQSTLIETNSPDCGEAIGQPWHWELSLADMGLHRIEEDAPVAA